MVLFQTLSRRLRIRSWRAVLCWWRPPATSISGTKKFDHLRARLRPSLSAPSTISGGSPTTATAVLTAASRMSLPRAAPNPKVPIGVPRLLRVIATMPNGQLTDVNGFLDDIEEDDYTNDAGTSMAAPHVTGQAALIIQALEQDGGHPWTYSENDALLVKRLILMAATETNQNRQCGNSGTCEHPVLNRGVKDKVEGFGKINVDASIEAATMYWDSLDNQAFLGPEPFQRKCWARKIPVCEYGSQNIVLQVPGGADFDLYFYRDEHDADGNPLIEDTDHSTSSDDNANDETLDVPGPEFGEVVLLPGRQMGQRQRDFYG